MSHQFFPFYGPVYSLNRLTHLFTLLYTTIMYYNISLFVGLSILLIYKYKSLSPILILGLYASIFPLIQLDPFALTSLSSKALLYTVIVMLAPRGCTLFYSSMLLINSLYVIFSPGHYGLGLATSVDAMLIAIMYPMYLKEIGKTYTEGVVGNIIKLIIVPIPVIAIFIARGSVGIGGLCLGLLIIYRKSLLILIPIALFSIYAYIDPRLFNDSLRFICWEWSMDWWWSNANHWLGTGMGTYFVLGPYIQAITNNSIGSWYTLMHNDWLQALFELGYIGLAIITLTYLYIIYRVRNDRHALATVIVFGACALLYYPTKNILLACYAVSMIKNYVRL